MIDSLDPKRSRAAWLRSIVRPNPYAIVLTFAASVVAALAVISPWTLASVFINAVSALIVVVPPILFGLWLVRRASLGPMSPAWRLLLAATFGLSAASLSVLVLGCAGLLQRPMWLVLLVAAAATGVAELRRRRSPESTATPRVEHSAAHWLWMLAAPFLVIALLNASAPPGTIFQEEGFGYDVLEYHLQLPKEYLQAGRITYLPHNVYGCFPANVEMLYLLAMIVHGPTPEVALVANMIHLMLAGLTVFAAWTVARDWSPAAGNLAAITTATTGWLAYLSGLAYVENGLLLFTIVALGSLLRAKESETRGEPRAFDRSPNAAQARRRLMVSGLASGFACGCKYTGIALTLLPVLAAAGWLQPTFRRRLTSIAIVAASALASFSPWLVHNAFTTGNPVFPLANRWLAATPPGWTAAETEHWESGHQPPPGETAPTARLVQIWRRIAADPHQRFGPVLLLLGPIGLLGRRRTSIDRAILVVVVLQLFVWLVFTHLFARFAVALIAPLVLLAGRAVGDVPSPWRQRAMLLALAGGAIWNLYFASEMTRAEVPVGLTTDIFVEGTLPGEEHLGMANRELPADARLLLIGEARAFYFQRPTIYCTAFNRNAFLERAAARDTQAAAAWLQTEGISHVLVNWIEVHRIVRTYGFSPPVTTDQLRETLAVLEGAVLHRIQKYSHPSLPSSKSYVDVYEVGARP